MKTQFLQRPLLPSFAGLILAGTLLLSACNKHKDDNIDQPAAARYSLTGAASGDQEVPAVATSGAASLTGSYDTLSRKLTYVVNWTALSGEASAAHFHGPAAPGESADVLEPLTIGTNGISGSASGTINATAALHSALMSGKLYYNIHTAANPDGEIRGQVQLSQ